MQRALLAGLATWVMVLFCSCSRSDRPRAARLIETAAQMNAPEYVIALPTGAAAMMVGEKLFPRARLSYQTTHADAYAAVKTGKADAYIYDRHALEYVVAKNPDLALLPDDLGEQNIVVGIPLARPELLSKVNDFIEAYRAWALDVRQDGRNAGSAGCRPTGTDLAGRDVRARRADELLRRERRADRV